MYKIVFILKIYRPLEISASVRLH